MTAYPTAADKDLALLRRLLAAGQGRVHMIGICGIGMAGLAFLLAKSGFAVSGCDARPNHLRAWLQNNGIPVAAGHDASHIGRGADWVVRTSALDPADPEVAAAAKAHIPVFRRGAVLAEFSRKFDLIAVCGTHGKTTVSAMISHILRKAGRDVAFFAGGETPCLGSVPAGMGSERLMVAETDESDGTLALYSPETTVVTSLDFDHAESFAGPAEFAACFDALLQKTSGEIFFCADDPRAAELCSKYQSARGYGLDRTDAEFTAVISGENAWKTAMEVRRRGETLGSIEIPLPGRHNALNALAACAVAAQKGVAFPAISEAAASFSPARRRFERIASRDDILVISDYAHHPAEITAGIKTALALGRARNVGVFQPHRHTRTRALCPAFATAFDGLDLLVLCPVYSAWEQPVEGGNSWDLYAAARKTGKVKIFYASSLSQTSEFLESELKPGDGAFVFGAGDVEQIAAELRDSLDAGGAQGMDSAGKWAMELARLGLDPLRRAPLAGHTTFGVGGAADILIEARDIAGAQKAIRYAAESGAPLRILGRGSNVLISDLGVRGIVMKLAGADFSGITELEGGIVAAGANVPLKTLLAWAVRRGRDGFNFLTGIPGSLGGAVAMNAGAGGMDISGSLAWVRTIDSRGVETVTKAEKLDFQYRSCPALETHAIIEAAFFTGRARPQTLRADVAHKARRRAWMNGLRCAGSFFANPKNDFAGRLIEAAGLKGLAIGGAAVCERHANVIVASASASSSDIRALADKTAFEVARRFGVKLREEVKTFG